MTAVPSGFSSPPPACQVMEIVSCARRHLPSTLQNESHPYLQEKDLRDLCRINGIVFQVSMHTHTKKKQND